ncbi:translation initiation factor IF-3 [Candidatus Parcubacteria bacterium]|nr:MAG: translation initiation factor IF-3 [Candidatus Parcubacteria bacterium]
MRRSWKKAKPKIEKKFFTNEQIRADFVFLIGEEGEQIGKIETEKALQIAKDLEQDLVEVNPVADPPICKIMDYGQFKYESEKKAHKQRMQQKKVDTKAVRLSVRISKHDFEFRLEQAKKFLEKGSKLKIDLILKGREKAHPEKAVETIKGFIAELEQNEKFNLVREQDLTKQGGRFNIILVNKKN